MKRKVPLILISVAVVVSVAVVLLSVGAFTLGGEDSVSLRGDTERYTVKVELDAAKTGTRTAIVDVAPRAGDPAPDEVSLEAAMVVHSHAAPALIAVRQSNGRFRVIGDLFFMTGPFELTVALTTGGQREQVTFPITVTS